MAIALCIGMLAMPVSADQPIRVQLNGTYLTFDVQPQLINDRTMVPMRAIFEALGAEVSWDDATETVTATKSGTVIKMKIGSNAFTRNGDLIDLDVPAQLVGDRTLVPVRAIAESFRCSVNWDDPNQTVVITSIKTDSKDIPLSASEISEKIAPAVFYIEVYDEAGKPFALGSGFFVSADGVAVTNEHVIHETSAAVITTTDGKSYNVTHILDYDEDYDLAVLRVDKTALDGTSVTAFPYLTLGDSDKTYNGQTVYSIGSPLGLQNTIANGIISNNKRETDTGTCLQITAPISHGSSGGALVNEYGEVVGITFGGFEDGQNLGFAIPVNDLKRFDLTAEGLPYQEAIAAYLKISVSSSVVVVAKDDFATVYVTARGTAEDQTLYWHSANEGIAYCEWGDWVSEDTSALYIYGKMSGNTNITIYSDLDETGTVINVEVIASTVPTYVNRTAATYTYITGAKCLESYDGKSELRYAGYDPTGTLFTYQYVYQQASDYMDYLVSIGYTHYDTLYESYGYMFCFDGPGGIITVTLATPYNEVWIGIPR